MIRVLRGLIGNSKPSRTSTSSNIAALEELRAEFYEKSTPKTRLPLNLPSKEFGNGVRTTADLVKAKR